MIGTSLMLQLIRFLTPLLVVVAFTLGQAASALEYRSIDGSGNNVANTLWGSADTPLMRQGAADYRGDAGPYSAVDDRGRPNPRTISNRLFAQTTSIPNSRGMMSGVWQWGQFLDHDIDLTPSYAAESSVILSPNDPYGVTMIPFSRSIHTTDTNGDRQQTNHITSYIDGSNVYGSDATRAAALREMTGGRLKTSADGKLMPTDAMPGLGSLDNDNGGFAGTMFVAGDIRANEQFGLTAMHTLFVREHNRLADTLAANNVGDANWDDERIYQTARRIVGAQIQAITYNEFLPALLGEHAPSATLGSDYAGYNPNVDPAIANAFSTAMFRVGHTMLNEDLLLGGDGGTLVGSVSLSDAFFKPSQMMQQPELVEQVLMGLSMQSAQEIDTNLVDEVRNKLFTPNGTVGMDLAALNIERGRDHGLPDYNTLREAYGLDAVSSFADISSDGEVQQALSELYGSVDNIDPWVGALSEDHIDGASVGELISVALIDQFVRIRDGDRFFYAVDEYLLSNGVAEVIDFDTLTLTDIVNWNTSMSKMPSSFFMATAVPEPATGLALLGLISLACSVRRRI